MTLDLERVLDEDIVIESKDDGRTWVAHMPLENASQDWMDSDGGPAFSASRDWADWGEPGGPDGYPFAGVWRKGPSTPRGGPTPAVNHGGFLLINGVLHGRAPDGMKRGSGTTRFTVRPRTKIGFLEHDEYENFAARAEGEWADASKVARSLLSSHLSGEQLAEFEATGSFHAVSRTGRRYRIMEKTYSSVSLVDENGVELERYCIHPTTGVPDCDAMLSQKLLVESNEKEFLRLANRFPPGGGIQTRPDGSAAIVAIVNGQRVPLPFGSRVFAHRWCDDLGLREAHAVVIIDGIVAPLAPE